MEVKKIQLRNIGRFADITVPLATESANGSNITVFVGNNGAGKTTLLKSLSTALSWFVARLRREKGNGRSIAEIEIKNGQNDAQLTLQLAHSLFEHTDCHWLLAKTRQGRMASQKSELADVTRLAAYYRESLTLDDTVALPLICFYSVERYVDEPSVALTKKTHFDQFDGYDNSNVSFRRFFAWFRQREDIENEQLMNPAALAELKKHLPDKQYQAALLAQQQFKDKQLEAVRQAIDIFMPNYRNLKIRRKPRLHMTVEKNAEVLDVAQLSQGEKSLLALIGDIARRLAIMNPANDNPLAGDGIVLIDEVDMHLHPQWQRCLIDKLSHTFPRCQFVLTTHSPLVISDPQKVLCYGIDGDQLAQLDNLYGQDANQVLLDVMDTDIRNEAVQNQLDNVLDLIQDGELIVAREQIERLAELLSAENIELMKVRLLLRKMEIRLDKAG